MVLGQYGITRFMNRIYEGLDFVWQFVCALSLSED